ncbi:MAG TPA: hypothetical protein VLJ68_09890 [Chitinophagaceae bacterium]|nr:hypothetical protein [Chitinophagaceae bacterium]
MNTTIKENIAVNNQEDEDGYVLYPSCAIIENEITSDPVSNSLTKVENRDKDTITVKKKIGSFALSPLIYPGD